MSSSLTHTGAVLSSLSASMVASFPDWRGVFAEHTAVQPPKPLILYEFEACPFCRVVREAMTALHLDVEIRPCPRGGARHRPEAQRLGGKLQFPLLIDTNTDALLYESRDIVDYLFRTYAPGARTSGALRAGLERVRSALASGIRFWRGRSARPSKTPGLPLQLWSFEASPYSRLARERLCELELPYTLHNLGKEHWKELGPASRRLAPNPYVPREGGKRHAFWKVHGRVQVPYLEDPNTGAAIFESKDILDYLSLTYAA